MVLFEQGMCSDKSKLP